MHSPGTSDSVDSGPSNEALRAWASLQCGDVGPTPRSLGDKSAPLKVGKKEIGICV